MAKTIRLDIVTPERMVFSDDVNMIIARATDGDVGILPGHAHMIAGLTVWPLRIIKDEVESQISLCGGFMEVRPEKVTILASCAEKSEEIDIERAQHARERAETRLKERPEGLDVVRAEAALHRAIMRLKIAETEKNQ